MKKISSVIIVLAIILSVSIFTNNSIAKKATNLLCCNDYDPRQWNNANWSWNCMEAGEEIEIVITWEQCYCVWYINNWQQPIGMACNILQQCMAK